MCRQAEIPSETCVVDETEEPRRPGKSYFPSVGLPNLEFPISTKLTSTFANSRS